MAHIFAWIFLASVLMLAIGMINSKWALPKSLKPTRSRVLQVYGATFFASLILTGLTAPKVEPPSASVSQPIAASPAVVSPVAIAPSPQPAGIGVSRASIQSVFEKPEVGFRFESSSNVNGQPRVMGSSPNGLTTVELIGPPNNLVSATIMVGIPNDDANARAQNVLYTLGFIKHAAPQWSEGNDWFNASLMRLANGAESEASTSFAGNKAELNVIREMGIFTLSISPR